MQPFTAFFLNSAMIIRIRKLEILLDRFGGTPYNYFIAKK
ncbi:hypothetical protein D1AOALGA4SA_12214 [Olavius algarvensis Delta 1 endosymbiont]|nr:hypothetical protein D1AOALGA4SA_12214 [Olavius algarvensis Delta 1 endosymbiont]